MKHPISQGRTPQTVTDMTLIPDIISAMLGRPLAHAFYSLRVVCMQRGAAQRAACPQTGVEYLNASRFNWRSNWNRKLRNEEQPPSTGSLLAAQSGAASLCALHRDQTQTTASGKTFFLYALSGK